MSSKALLRSKISRWGTWRFWSFLLMHTLHSTNCRVKATSAIWMSGLIFKLVNKLFKVRQRVLVFIWAILKLASIKLGNQNLMNFSNGKFFPLPLRYNLNVSKWAKKQLQISILTAKMLLTKTLTSPWALKITSNSRDHWVSNSSCNEQME